MQFKKAFRVLFSLMLVSCMIFQEGCTISHKPLPKNKKITIGFSMDSIKEERWNRDKASFVSHAEALGAKVICDIAFENSSTQIIQVKQMISQGIDVLVIIPHDATTAADAVAAAKKAGIPVISYDRLVLNADVNLFISFDNVKVGELMAETITKARPNGNYVIVNGPPSDYNTVMISRGIKEILNPYITRGDIMVIKEFSTPDWMANEASDGINKLLQNTAKIDAVIAENDNLAAGVITTLSDYRLLSGAKFVPVVGMDADLDACQRVVEGIQLMTVYKPIDQLASRAATFAVDMAKGQKIAISNKISDGKYNVPYCAVEPIAVNKDNMMSTVISDGFHKQAEVYMNVPLAQQPAH